MYLFLGKPALQPRGMSLIGGREGGSSPYAWWMGKIGKIHMLRTCEHSRHLTTQEGCMITELVV